MNFKFGFLAFLLGIALIASCTKEDIDDTVVDEDEVVTQVDSCDLNLEITEYDGGILAVNVNGGTEPYVYEWSNGETADSIAVDSGTYEVTATDSQGCTASASVTVGEPCLSLNAYITTDTLGTTLTATVTGGTAPYVYQWSTGETSQSVTASGAGTYEVTVIDSQGCTVTTSTTIGGGDCSSFWLGIEPAGDSTGMVLIAYVDGGTAPYTYQWSTGETVQTISVTGDGTYEVTVTDAIGCTAIESITLTETSCNSFNASITVNGPTLIANVSGGTAPYVYQWSTGEMSQNITVSSSGWYELSVTDSEGCIVFNSTYVEIADPCSSLYVWMQTDSTATMLIASPVGGTAPYLYEWSTGAMSQSIDISNAAPDTYEVTVTDSEGCTFTTSITIDECFSLSISFELDDAGTTLTAIPDGGTAPYFYEWYLPGGTTANTASIPVVSGATYAIYMYDSVGCGNEWAFEVP